MRLNLRHGRVVLNVNPPWPLDPPDDWLQPETKKCELIVAHGKVYSKCGTQELSREEWPPQLLEWFNEQDDDVLEDMGIDLES